MNGLIAWWARNPVAANLLMIGIVITGFLGFMNIEREAFPVIKANNVEVIVAWPGAAPQEVEEQIIVRVEEALTDLDNIDRIFASANEGSAYIWVRALGPVDMGAFVGNIKRRVDAISSLPRDIERPIVREQIYRDQSMRIGLYGDIGERQLTRLAEDLRDEVAMLPGISIVELFGTRREEVSVELSEEALRRYGLSFDEVARAIGATSVNISSGRVRTESGDILLRARNLANTQTEFENIILRQGIEGGILRVGDVAKVVDGFEEEDILATLNGEPAVLIQVMSQEHMDVVKASDSVHKWVEETQKHLPEGVGLTIWWDNADVYKGRMETIVSSAITGLLLVFIILILTLRPKVALWVTVGIATAYMGSLALLPSADVSLNVISTFAFLLVLGIVVDDAIVVGESIHHTAQQRGGTVESAIMGTQLVAKPVMFAVLTTMIAFMPWLFLSGEDVQITRHISIVIILSLTFSLIEAFFILPAHLRTLAPESKESNYALVRKFLSLQQAIAHSIIHFARTTYRRSLAFSLRHRYATVATFVGVFIISMGVFSSGWVKFSFMPEIEGDGIYINVDLPNDTPYDRALQILKQIQAAEKQLVDEVNAAAEEGQGKLVENWYTRSRRDSVLAMVKLVPPSERELSAKDVALRLKELIGDVPDAEEITVNYTTNDSVPRLSYAISHPDMDTLLAASEALQAKLRSYDSVYYVRDDLQGSVSELHFTLLPGAERMGFTLREVSRQVRQAYYGEEVQRLPRENGDVRVMVRYPKAERYNLASLENFRLRTPDGSAVPLLSVVDVEVASGVKEIKRRERRRSSTVNANLITDVGRDIQKDLDENFFPEWEKQFPGVIRGAVGQAEGEARFFKEVTSLYLLAFFVMYWLLAVAFGSYVQPLIIMTAIPFGYMGAVYGHLIFGLSMALFSYFGIAAAAGVVVNDNLVLMDYVNRAREQGMNALDAVLEAGAERFRPILLTTVTTFVGLIPMMAERSIQAQFLHPAVISLAFGVLVALAVTLYLVPSLYCIGEEIREGFAKRFKRQPKTLDEVVALDNELAK
jgi:multidrug efflux pump subunit AcrB